MSEFGVGYPIFFAFCVTLLAGLATGFGSLLALFSRPQGKGFLSVSLGFSAGVMLYVSLVEIFPKSQEMLGVYSQGGWWALGSFIGGIVLVGGIDALVPSYENPHEFRDYKSDPKPQLEHLRLLRVGGLLALLIAVHNFPEGLATFLAVLQDPKLGFSLAVAIAIHNIPEGISISVPIYYSTGSKRKAFWYSFLSGLAEPVGALVGYFVLLPFLNAFVLGVFLQLLLELWFLCVWISFCQLQGSTESIIYPFMVWF